MEVLCGTCKSILKEDYKFKHCEIKNKEYETVLKNAKMSKTSLIKLVSMIVFVYDGNTLIVKSKNGQNNIGVYDRRSGFDFLNEVKQKLKVKSVISLVDWIDSICDVELLAILLDELYDISTHVGYYNKLGNE
jgi:hypothetical protein